MYCFQIRYTGYRDRPQEERQVRFHNGCREGHTEIAFISSGTNIQIVFNPNYGPYMPEKELDFEQEEDKVNNSSHFEYFNIDNKLFQYLFFSCIQYLYNL